jgi:hypothetical protein
MNKIILAIAVVLLTSLANAATISFSPGTLSVARGAASGDISVQIAGDSSTTMVEAGVNISLDQFSFYQIQSFGSSQCTLTGGKLQIFALVNASATTPFPAGPTTVCKLKVRPRITASLAAYSLYFTNVYGYNISGSLTAISGTNATVNITP